MINGLPRFTTVNNLLKSFICCPIERCIIGKFNSRQLEILTFNVFTYGVRKRSGKTKEDRDGVDSREGMVWRLD